MTDTAVATKAKQTEALAVLASILAKLSGDPATQTTLAAALTALQQSAPAGLTYTRVKIDQTAAAGVTALVGALAENYSRLHAIIGTMEAAGTLTIEDSEGTDLSGPMPVAEDGGFVIEFGNVNHCPVTAAGKGLAINTTQKFYGFAVVSQGTS